MPAVPLATSHRRSTPIGLRTSEPKTIRRTTGDPRGTSPEASRFED
jgi:hypothetical protein